MSIFHALIVFTHLISFLGFTTIAITGQIHPAAIVVFYAALLLSYINDRYKKKYYLNQRTSTVLAFGVVLYIVISILYLSTEVFTGILNFLIAIQMVRLLSFKGMRETIQIYLISFFQFMAGAILSIEITYGAVLIVYIFVSLGALIVYNLKKESDYANVQPDQAVVSRTFMGSSVFLSIVVIFISAVMFVMLPRLKTEFFSSNFIQPKMLKTGFSDTVKLGQVGEIKKDSSAVMRVRLLNRTEKINKDLYWRGIALDHFDGYTWRVDSERFGDYEAKHKQDRHGIIRVRKSADNVIEHQIITEPIDTDMLFALNSPVGYSLTSGLYRRYRGSIYEVNNSYYLPFSPQKRIHYKAYSELDRRPDESLNGEPESYSYYIKQRYLQLPAMSQEIVDLAADITKNDSTNYERSSSILRYLLEEMNYTLTLQSGEKDFPLETFLLEKKEGHCEYFATAMVVLLRLNGIPSRIVNGFIGGSWNEHGNFYLIKESDAHSWVEVFFPNSGWVTFDPTPSSLDLNQYTGLLGAAVTYFDYLKYRWQRYVIDYSRTDQVRLFATAGQKLSFNTNKAFSKFKLNRTGNKRGVLYILAAGLIIFVVYSSRSFLGFNKSSNGRQSKITKIYEQSLRYLAKKGYEKKDSQTPLEFSDYILSTAGSKFLPFKDFTTKYNDMRFDDKTSKNIDELKNLLDKVKNIKQ